jgi:hypothetical protein
MAEQHADIDLDALFAADLPPKHDADFLVAVAQRVARRRLALELAWGALMAVVAAVVLWAVAPLVNPLLEPVGKMLLIVTPAAVIAAVTLLLTHPRTSQV